ncbi:MAG: OprO/OprP family phosphate-selective porin [Alistipes sp.]|nr:OprO/OprP family phosphate-selective porin [Alistipes sp.]
MEKRLLAIAAMAALLAFVPRTATAQYRESETVMDRLIWDDEKLNILLDTRFDLRLTTGNSDGKELGFRAQTIKLWLTGEIVPGIRYRLRQKLNKSLDALRDNYASGTDHAWISFDVGKTKLWTITAGKQSINFGTFEYDYNSADVYLSTMINDDVDSHKAGVDVAYRAGKQTLHIQVVNSDATQFASDEYKNKGLGATFLWEGNLWDGKVKTRWAYSAFQHTRTRFYNWVTTGIQGNAGGFTVEADYYLGERNMDYGTIVDEASGTLSFVRDQSAALNLKYTAGRWHPSVKGVWNQRRDRELGRRAYDGWGIQALIEFYPFTAKYVKDLRFHAAWWYNRTDFAGPYAGLPNSGGHTALVGMRWLFKAK